MARKINTIGWVIFIGICLFNLYGSILEKDYSEAAAWFLIFGYSLADWRAETRKDWIVTSEMPPATFQEVIGFHPDWVYEDFNGTRIGFMTEDGRFLSAAWDYRDDLYVTESDLIPTHWQSIEPVPQKLLDPTNAGNK